MDTASFLSVALALAAVVAVSLLLLNRLRYGKLPPGPRPWPVVGNLFDVQPVRCRCYQEWARRYGPIMTVWLGTASPTVVVSTAELAREVLKTHDQQLADRARDRSSERFSRGGQDLIWADYGAHYIKVRKLCNLELFTQRRLEALRPVREDEVTAMVESVYKAVAAAAAYGNEGKPLVVKNHLSMVAFNNITRLAFGKRFVNAMGELDEQGREFKAIITNGIKIGASLSIAQYIPWLRWLSPVDEQLFKAHGDRRDRLTVKIMEEHAEALKQRGAKQHFVDALFTLREKYDLSDDTVIGLLWDMITAGADTTVISVEWAMAELVRNPTVQEKLQEELDRVVGRHRVLLETDFLNLPYLQAVVKESLRLHPPTPLMLPHKASTGVKIAGYDIPKGANVIVNVWAVARDPKVWDNPMEFRPERFLEENIDIKGADFRVLPFGAGRRVCPGAQLGINLVASMIGHMVHHFKWTLPEGVRPEDVNMMESPGLVTFMATPPQAVATPRLDREELYRRLAMEVLKTHDQQLANRSRTRTSERFSRGGQDLIWADYGAHYIKLCNLELFTPRRLEAFRSIREDEVTAMVESVYKTVTAPGNKGKPIVVRDHLSMVGFNNITRLAFGKRFVNAAGELDEQGREFKEINTNGTKIGASLSIAQYIRWLRWLAPVDEKIFRDHEERRDRLTVKIMEEHAKALKQQGAKQHFIDALFTLKDQYDLSDDTVICLLWDMITAGADTTVIAVEWAIAELVRNPMEELDRVIGCDRVLSETDFPNLPYLQAVVKESLRLHPPTPLMLPHKASASVKIAGYDIPKGTNVIVNVWAVARDPKIWDKPLEFMPERFLRENIDIKGADFRVLPFGAGRRVCPGAQLGINLVTSMIGHMVHHFHWALPNGTRPEDVNMMETPGLITFMATPLQVVATPRLHMEEWQESFELPPDPPST
ncbi:hypothetical protein U9M48_010424 [Paspalum notatum var. saurae]|uniref:Coumarate 3-hydroxylase n=1 Tax=Paspalum notatum var. saurae TaxID=547442 RepID=A0AAQ3STE4_PASNO